MNEVNPKIIHRIYFPNYAPFYDPFEHYVETWRREMPEYEIKIWNATNLDLEQNEWTRCAARHGSPVFLSEYFRWQVLNEYGGLYLDADCEILNGRILDGIVNDLYAQGAYDSFFGVEERTNGHPTAQTFGARRGCDLVRFMKSLYEDRLAPFWPWREKRGLIGPQLMSLYFLNQGINLSDDGFFKYIVDPVIVNKSMIYPQSYFSPKFTLAGDTLDYVEDRTCVYHMFANSNVDFTKQPLLEEARRQAKTFSEYQDALHRENAFPRRYSSNRLSTTTASHTSSGLIATNVDGLISYGPYISLPPGAYTAEFRGVAISRGGTIQLVVTDQQGQNQLAETFLQHNRETIPSLSVRFTVPEAGSQQLEVLLRATGLESLVINELVISQCLSTNASWAASKTRDGAEHPAQASAIVSSPLKTIHRIYFGFDGRPDVFRRYLETWIEQLPDFEIRHWNASNLPMDINPYVTRLYAERDHAFLTDYFRWYVLREFGGVYFDADVEVIDGDIFRDIIDQLATAGDDYDAVIGIDEKGGGWYTAHTVAARVAARLPTYMCECYDGLEKLAAWRKNAFYLWAPQLTAVYFAENGHHVDGMGTTPHLVEPIVACDVKIYPQTWFAPLAPTGNPDKPFVVNALSADTCLCHHFACTWHAADSFYKIHSAESGGQTNVLLHELIEKDGRWQFPAAALPSLVGRKLGKTLETDGRPGFLVFGPYVTLPEGSYRATFFLNRFVELGLTEIDVVYADSESVLTRRLCEASEGAGGRLAVAFDLRKATSGVEVRLRIDDRADFAIGELIILQDGEHESRSADALQAIQSSATGSVSPKSVSASTKRLIPTFLRRWIDSYGVGRGNQ